MEELKNIKVALLGSGTVGTGVYKLIERQREELPHKVGAGLTVSKVLVRDKNKKREGIDPSVLTDQWEDIITDDEIQIVVEVMGGIEPARTYITEALQAGKNVVTANKDLMAVHGGELLDIASHNGCDLLFEASVPSIETVSGRKLYFRSNGYCQWNNKLHSDKDDTRRNGI